ncbi:MAG: hypothetical protein ABJM43_13120 [Paracoccaceae bacterium]
MADAPRTEYTPWSLVTLISAGNAAHSERYSTNAFHSTDVSDAAGGVGLHEAIPCSTI